jgi:hypothetical protein
MAKASGYTLTAKDAPTVLGMEARGDREHDIACWFGVNQGRVAEVKVGKFGTPPATPAHELPPKGPPGIKGRRLRTAVEQVLSALSNGNSTEAVAKLQKAIAVYDANEA